MTMMRSPIPTQEVTVSSSSRAERSRAERGARLAGRHNRNAAAQPLNQRLRDQSTRSHHVSAHQSSSLSRVR